MGGHPGRVSTAQGWLYRLADLYRGSRCAADLPGGHVRQRDGRAQRATARAQAERLVEAYFTSQVGYLPADLPSNPTYRKINPADSPVIILEMTSEAMTQDQMYDVADSIMGQKLSQIEGVGQVFVWGSSQPAVRIEANPTP